VRLYNDILCLLTDPLGFEDPPPGVPVEAWTRRWMDIISAMARFLLSVPKPCCVPSPPTPSQHPVHACSTPYVTDYADTIVCLDGSPAFVTSVFLASPSVSPPAHA
jgi:hypothetical protein